MGSASITDLLDLGDSEALRERLRRDESLRREEVVVSLVHHVLELSRSDPVAARELATDASWLADRTGSDRCRGLAARAEGHMLALQGSYPEALARYTRAIELFELCAEPVEAGISLTAALKPLSYLGRYDTAAEHAERATQIFSANDELHRLAQLRVNLGNIEFRRDRFEEALEHYRGALELLTDQGSPRDVGVVLRNILVCYISVGAFEAALKAYAEARRYCEERELKPLVTECDYNIAYLYYLRGEYGEALRIYRETRQLSHDVDDPYHEALCDLDLCELHLELNLLEEARELAKAALSGFERLGVSYEAAKALVYLGQAAGRSGRPDLALKFFDRAQAALRREGNRVWLAWIDLQRAATMRQQGELERARKTAEAARTFFSDSPLDSKAALCELAVAELELETGNAERALERCEAARQRIRDAEAPIVSFQSQLLTGDVLLALGERERAAAAFAEARTILERLRGDLPRPSHRIGFLQNRVGVYSRLFALSLGSEVPDIDEAFRLAESAKSRHLLDLLSTTDRVGLADPLMDAESARVRGLQARLNTLYRLADTAELDGAAEDADRLRTLRRRITTCEADLTRVRREEAETTGQSQPVTTDTLSPDEARASLLEDETLVEYFAAAGHLHALVMTTEHLTATRLGPLADIQRPLELFRYQLSKFRLDSDYGQRFAELMRTSTARHLATLYRMLIRPVRDQLLRKRLIVVPHGPLHYIPFHALEDGGRPLIADFAISYAPSASILGRCRRRPGRERGASLVMAVADPRAPAIEAEAAAVALALGVGHVLTGAEATARALREIGPGRRVIHLATHGLFRRDNAMFSAIQLADRRLSLQDLHRMHLPSELVVLSGCGTGLSVVHEGDELLGLASGMLSAGARSVLVALWDVDDESATELMRGFYQRLQAGADKAGALREAMLDSAAATPHPYYWAPFVLLGDPRPSVGAALREDAKAGP